MYQISVIIRQRQKENIQIYLHGNYKTGTYIVLMCKNGTVTCQLLLGEVPIGLATYLKRLCIIKMISKDIQLACKYKVPNQDELKAKLSSQTGILRWNWQEWTHSYALAFKKETRGEKELKYKLKDCLGLKKRGFIFEKVMILSLSKTKCKIFCI